MMLLCNHSVAALTCYYREKDKNFPKLDPNTMNLTNRASKLTTITCTSKDQCFKEMFVQWATNILGIPMPAIETIFSSSNKQTAGNILKADIHIDSPHHGVSPLRIEGKMSEVIFPKKHKAVGMIRWQVNLTANVGKFDYLVVSAIAYNGT